MPQPSSSARVLAFDVFGTVVDWRSGVIAAGERIGSRLDVFAEWPSIADDWRAAYQPSLDRVRRGELEWTPLERLLRLSLDELLPRFGLASLPNPERDELTRAWRLLSPWPDVADGLARLHRRFILATLSNGSVAQLVDLARHGGTAWDVVLSGELVRRYKPDPEVYELVPRLLDVRAAEVVMVAAHVDDLRAARRSGLRTAYIHRPREFGPGSAPEVTAPDDFDYVAADFLDLATRLGA